MGYSSEEKETLCSFDYITGCWTINSTVPRHITKLLKIAEPTWVEREGERVIAGRWVLHSNQVRFAQEIVSKMTPEQKEAAKERLQQAREKRKEIV